MFYKILRNKQMLGYRFLRQKPILNYILDFYCNTLKLGVEVDGDTHAEHKSYDKAVNKVLAGLAAAKHGASQVYRVDVPGKKQTIIGVSLTDGESSDTFIMNEVDFKDIRSTAHLPYELLIDKDGKVYALNARFRIAASFPDLSMSGDNSFMRIMSSPDAIKKSLSLTSGQEAEKKSGGFF